MTDSPIDHLDAQSGYDAWANIYDDENNPLIALEEPLMSIPDMPSAPFCASAIISAAIAIVPEG